jgi:hypothetical protein
MELAATTTTANKINRRSRLLRHSRVLGDASESVLLRTRHVFGRRLYFAKRTSVAPEGTLDAKYPAIIAHCCLAIDLLMPGQHAAKLCRSDNCF